MIEISKFKGLDMNEVSEIVGSVPANAPSREELALALSLIDLTSLEGKDNVATVLKLCEKAQLNATAAVCVYPSLVSIAKKKLSDSTIHVASVAGAFPSAQLPLDLRLEEVRYALAQGADEIDMVISRGKFLEGDYQFVYNEISAVKKECGDRKLKVILEIGELETIENVFLASQIAISAGADFIKTSTGKTNKNSTLEFVATMLLAIKMHFEKTGIKVGIKPSGGISDGETAAKYIRIVKTVLGEDWLNAELFRFGASRLVDSLAIADSGSNSNEVVENNY